MQKYNYAVCLLLLFASSCSLHYRIEKSPHAQILNEAEFKKAHVGISIYDPSTKKYLFSKNSESNFIPASTTKIFTLYAGMKYLGDSLTGAFYKKENDTLFLVPNADPTFMSENFTTHPLLEKIRKNEGPICFVFPTDSVEPYGPGWAWEDQQERYMAQRSVMPVYENQLKLVYARKNIVDSNFSLVQMNTEVPEFSHSIKYDTTKSNIRKYAGTNRYVVSLNQKEIETSFKIPFETFGNQAAIKTLVNLSYHKPSFQIVSYIPYREFLPSYSQKSDSAFSLMMHESDNFYAEQILLMSAVARTGKMNQKAIIDTLLQNDFKDMPQQPRWVDGSGLSRYNLFSPNDEIYVLDKLMNEFGAERLESIFPTGSEGTMKNMFTEESGSVFAKTGSLGNTFCISGWMYNSKRKPILFSVMVNQYMGKNKTMRESVESFLKTVRIFID